MQKVQRVLLVSVSTRGPTIGFNVIRRCSLWWHCVCADVNAVVARQEHYRFICPLCGLTVFVLGLQFCMTVV